MYRGCHCWVTLLGSSAKARPHNSWSCRILLRKRLGFLCKKDSATNCLCHPPPRWKTTRKTGTLSSGTYQTRPISAHTRSALSPPCTPSPRALPLSLLPPPLPARNLSHGPTSFRPTRTSPKLTNALAGQNTTPTCRAQKPEASSAL